LASTQGCDPPEVPARFTGLSGGWIHDSEYAILSGERQAKEYIMPKLTLGTMIKETRSAKELTIADVAANAKCSVGYVHKLESDGVKSPSPKVLQRLSATLGIPYDAMMSASGYVPPTTGGSSTELEPTDYSNAHIVKLLRQIQIEVSAIKAALQMGRGAQA
jgi:transcriptional regulator with XRE-family HTH domain